MTPSLPVLWLSRVHSSRTADNLNPAVVLQCTPAQASGARPAVGARSRSPRRGPSGPCSGYPDGLEGRSCTRRRNLVKCNTVQYSAVSSAAPGRHSSSWSTVNMANIRSTHGPRAHARPASDRRAVRNEPNLQRSPILKRSGKFAPR